MKGVGRAAIAGGLAGGMSAMLGSLWLPPVSAMAAICLGVLMGAVAINDLRHFRVPDPLVVATFLGGFLFLALGSGNADERYGPLVEAAVSSALCGGALLAVREGFYRIRGADGLGLGDVKLAAAAGVWIDWQLFAIAVLLAAVLALTMIAAAALRNGWRRDRRIPFAAYLAPSVWICWFAAQDPITEWIQPAGAIGLIG